MIVQLMTSLQGVNDARTTKILWDIQKVHRVLLMDIQSFQTVVVCVAVTILMHACIVTVL